uniref:Uncharacterized protein n=1 Tax=Anopheles christyi TaxID=43041 RepID=A0A182KIU8_9DIPT
RLRDSRRNNHVQINAAQRQSQSVCLFLRLYSFLLPHRHCAHTNRHRAAKSQPRLLPVPVTLPLDNSLVRAIFSPKTC